MRASPSHSGSITANGLIPLSCIHHIPYIHTLTWCIIKQMFPQRERNWRLERESGRLYCSFIFFLGRESSDPFVKKRLSVVWQAKISSLPSSALSFIPFPLRSFSLPSLFSLREGKGAFFSQKQKCRKRERQGNAYAATHIAREKKHRHVARWPFIALGCLFFCLLSLSPYKNKHKHTLYLGFQSLSVGWFSLLKFSRLASKIKTTGPPLPDSELKLFPAFAFRERGKTSTADEGERRLSWRREPAPEHHYHQQQ